MIEHIQSIIEEDYCTKPGKKNKTLELKDGKPLMSISVKGLPQDALLIRIPSGKAHLSMLADKKNIKQSCDFVLLASDDSHVNVYFIELKKRLTVDWDDVPEDACKQILSTIPILDYLTSKARVHFQTPEKIQQYYVVLAESTGQKGLIKPKAVRSCKYKKFKFMIICALEEIEFGWLKKELLSM
jgi:hypothetical protein